MGEVLVPGIEHSLGESGVLRMHGHGGPVDVPHDDATAGPQGTVHLGQAGGRVGDVLQHLDAQRRVEARVLDGERDRFRLVELDVVVPVAPAGGQGQHGRAAVDPHDRPRFPHLLEQLGAVEAGSAADVQDALAR